MRAASLRAVVLALLLGATRGLVVWGQDPAAEPTYEQAVRSFRHAIGKRRESAGGPEWRALLVESGRLFERIATNTRSDDADAAWGYVVRVAYEAGDWDGVARAAERAVAFWDLPESKARATSEPGVASERAAQVAAIDYCRAAALVAAHEEEAALRILETYRSKHGQAASLHLGAARALQIEILLRRGAFEAAEPLISDAMREFPDDSRVLDALVRLAEHYRGQDQEFQRRIDDLAARRLALSQRIKSALGAGGGADEFRKQIRDLSDESDAVLRAQRKPVALAVRIEKWLDDRLKRLDAASPGAHPARNAADVSSLATRFLRLAVLGDGEASALDTAIALFEEWFTFPSVRARSRADPERRLNFRRYGEACLLRADVETNSGIRSVYADRAVNALERLLRPPLADGHVDRAAMVGPLPELHGDLEAGLWLLRAYRYLGNPYFTLCVLHVASQLIDGPIRLEEDSAAWWEVQSIVVWFRARAAERDLELRGSDDPSARQYVAAALDAMDLIERKFPWIGGLERHEATLPEWAALRRRLAELAETLGSGMPKVTPDGK